MVKRIELKVEDGIVECDCKGQDPSTSHISCTPLEFKYPCGTHPSVANTYGGSCANLRTIRHTSPAPPPPSRPSRSRQSTSRFAISKMQEPRPERAVQEARDAEARAKMG